MIESVVCIDSEYDRLFGFFTKQQLHELWQLTIAIDKRMRRRIGLTSYIHILENSDPRLVSLAWLMAMGSDEDVIRYLRGMIA